MPSDGYAKDVGAVVEVMELIAERWTRLFPDIRKLVVNYELSFPPGNLTLNVTSAPIPNPPDAGGEAVVGPPLNARRRGRSPRRSGCSSRLRHRASN